MMITRATADGNHVPSRRLQSGPRNVCRILFRHKWKMLTTFCAMMSLVIAGLLLFPRTYTSDARLFVRLGRESVGLDPTATISSTVNVEGSRESEINSELEILRSSVLLQDVVERLGSEVILGSGKQEPADEGDKAVTAGAGWKDAVVAALSRVEVLLNGEIGARERAVSVLEKNISVTAPRRSNVLIVKSYARSPELAQRILQTYLDAYHVRHATANRTSGSHDFFVAQADLLREQLDTVTRELRDAKNRERLTSVDGQRAIVQSEINLIESAMLTNERALASSEARIEALTDSLEKLPAQLDEEMERPSETASAMRTELYRVQILENEASARFTPEHPTVIALRQHLAETKKIFEQQEPISSHVTHRVNTVQQAAQTELLTAQATAAAHRAEAKSLEQQYQAIQAKVRRLNDNELQITDLARKAELLEASYRTYARNREQARIDQALETGRISNVNVVQPPSLVAKPSSPRNRIALVMGLLLALASAVFVGVAAELLDPSLKTAEEIEEQLDIPVLFSVPRGARNELIRN